jgi:phage tail-like protein
MSLIFRDGALHSGRDANDAWWISVRRPEEWGVDPRTPAGYGTRYDASRMVLELAPLELEAGSAAPPRVVAPDGTLYLVDVGAGRILRQRPCDSAPVPLVGVGGRGTHTGTFDAPAALALDHRGFLYVVDPALNRVQVIADEPECARVVMVLALQRPVAIAISAARIFVGCEGGVVQMYDLHFAVAGRFVAQRPGAAVPQIVALAVDAQGFLVLAERAWSRLSRFDCQGRFVDELGSDAAPDGLLRTLDGARFTLEGTRVVGPIDGGGARLAWHKVAVDAELPEGTSIEVQTWAADSLDGPPPYLPSAPALPAAPSWAPAEPVAMPLDAAEAKQSSFERPVLSDTSAWEQWQGAPYLRGSELRHRFQGDGPINSASFALPTDVARSFRTGDTLALRGSSDGSSDTERTIVALSVRTLSLIATGDRSAAYGEGAELYLRERDGHAREAARIHVLTADELIDLTTIASDAGGADIVLPHAIAALLYRGDVLSLLAGARSVQLVVDDVSNAPVTVTLDAPVSDFRAAELRISEPVGRLMVRNASAWGRGLSPGTTLSVQRVGSDGSLVGDPGVVVWSDPAVATVWLAAAPHVDWISLVPAQAPAATDRGRYLWVRLRLRGARHHASSAAATATPVVRALRVFGPRLSYLSYLPALYARRDDGDPSGALFLERFLALFEGRLTHIEGRYEAVARLLNPAGSDDEWLAFVAGWFDLVLDPSWPRARRAALLAQIFELYRMRGTPEGIVRFVEAYTGHRPVLVEGFQVRPRAGLVLGCHGVLGCAPLGGMDVSAATREEQLAFHAHRFTLVTYVDGGCDLERASGALRALVEAIKPAHVDVDLRIAVPHSRIGFESTVGLDLILGEERTQPFAPLGVTPPAPTLGVDAVLGNPSSASARQGSSPPAIGSFVID